MARLVLYGPAREAAGTRHDVLDAPTLEGVLDEAVRRYGEGFAEVLARSRVWVNGEPAAPDSSVAQDDEVAVLPPVSGG